MPFEDDPRLTPEEIALSELAEYGIAADTSLEDLAADALAEVDDQAVSGAPAIPGADPAAQETGKAARYIPPPSAPQIEQDETETAAAADRDESETPVAEVVLEPTPAGAPEFTGFDHLGHEHFRGAPSVPGAATGAAVPELAPDHPEAESEGPESAVAPHIPGAKTPAVAERPRLAEEPSAAEEPATFHRWKPFLVYLLALVLPFHIAAGVYLGIKADQGQDVFMLRAYLYYLVASAVTMAGLIVPLVVAHRSVRRALPKGERKGTLIAALVRFIVSITLDVVVLALTITVVDYVWRLTLKA